MDEIVHECEELAGRGVREITLLGQIVTSYGRRDYVHTDGVTPFVQLLERVNAIPGIKRIRFTSPHPRGFKDDLIEAYGRLEKLCEYVHLPLQSGSDRILKAMNRPYSRDRYKQIVDDLRRVRPDMYFSTDIIVGFPGETEAEFQQTRELFEACNYDMAFIFKYSIRSGTPAATLVDQISDEVKEERNAVLLKILEANSNRRNATLLGTTQEVLVEGPDKKGIGYMGRTRGNRIVHFAGNDRLIGELVPVKINRVSTAVLYGELTLAGMEA
jgi:tRNA-2-methylthio-N6-dimethylallyladenosine synthase